MLTTDTIGKAIELFERGSDDSSVAEATGISPEQARAITATPEAVAARVSWRRRMGPRPAHSTPLVRFR